MRYERGMPVRHRIPVAFGALLEYRVRYAETMGNLYHTRAEIGPLVGEAPLDWISSS